MPDTPPPPALKIPFWATFLTIIGLIILCTLGTWQLQRLSWKNDLIQKLDSAYNQKAPQEINLWQKTVPEFTYGYIKGTFLPDKAFLLGPPTMKNETPGLNLIVPIKTQDLTLLVNMGWTSTTLDKQPIHHLKNKEITFHGLLKHSKWNIFTPQNQPENDVWYRLNINEISTAKNLENLYPATLIADRANYKFDAKFFNDDNQNRPAPNNNHLQYALFWFTMAAILSIIYILRFFIKK